MTVLEPKSQITLQKIFFFGNSRCLQKTSQGNIASAWVTITLGQVTGKQAGGSLTPAWVLVALHWVSRKQRESLGTSKEQFPFEN